jgi:hypothetical protein
MPHLSRSGRFCAALALALLAAQAGAVPPDPERPLAEQTCAEALARLAEARQGSPLISPDEQAAVLARAEADSLRLCGGIPDLPSGTMDSGSK